MILSYIFFQTGYKNHKKSWTEEDDQQLLDLIQEFDLADMVLWWLEYRHQLGITSQLFQPPNGLRYVKAKALFRRSPRLFPVK